MDIQKTLSMADRQTTTPHDSAFKRFLAQIDHARDFFDIYLPENIKSLCDFNSLALTNSSFIDKKRRTRLSDVLYSVQTELGDGYLYLLIEHQSTPDKLMSWRLMHYAFLAMNQHLQQGHKTLPLVVPILFYHGHTSPYPYPKTWTHCFPWPKLADELYFKPFPLVDITIIDDNELVNHRKIAVMELAMKHKSLREGYKKVTSLLAQALNRHYNNSDDVATILNYLFVVLDSPNHYEQIILLLTEQIESNKEAVINIAQRLQDKGIQEGKRETAQQLLTMQIDVEIILKATGLTHQELLLLAQENATYTQS